MDGDQQRLEELEKLVKDHGGRLQLMEDWMQQTRPLLEQVPEILSHLRSIDEHISELQTHDIVQEALKAQNHQNKKEFMDFFFRVAGLAGLIVSTTWVVIKIIEAVST